MHWWWCDRYQFVKRPGCKGIQDALMMMWQVLIPKLDLPKAEFNTKNSTKWRRMALFGWVFAVQLDLLEKKWYRLREKPVLACTSWDPYTVSSKPANFKGNSIISRFKIKIKNKYLDCRGWTHGLAPLHRLSNTSAKGTVGCLFKIMISFINCNVLLLSPKGGFFHELNVWVPVV